MSDETFIELVRRLKQEQLQEIRSFPLNRETQNGVAYALATICLAVQGLGLSVENAWLLLQKGFSEAKFAPKEILYQNFGEVEKGETIHHLAGGRIGDNTRNAFHVAVVLQRETVVDSVGEIIVYYWESNPSI